MKICVVGGGNAGCLTALYFAYNAKKVTNLEIELIYDPETKPELVGQATLLKPPLLLWQACGVDWLNNTIKATPKLGIIYKGWGKKGTDLSSPFSMNSVGLHYSPHEMRDVVISSGLFKCREDVITHPENIDADYIFDCRGKPDNLDDYFILKNPLNAAILGKPRHLYPDYYPYTHAIATPDGWTFEIPTHSDSCSFPYSLGYLYNNTITTKDDAEKNFHSQFNVDTSAHITFKNYMAKKSILDERVILGGNRQFFLEPLESTAVESYLNWAGLMFQVIINKRKSFSECEAIFNKSIYQVQNYILWRYSFGSIYTTPFWEHAKSFTIKDLAFNTFIENAKALSWDDLTFGCLSGSLSGYGQWGAWHARRWLDGMRAQELGSHEID